MQTRDAEEQRVQDIVLVSQYVLSQDLLLEEFERQMRKHGTAEHPPEGWLGFLIEEVGEFATAMNQGRPAEACIELVQAIAVSIQIIRHYATTSVSSITGETVRPDDFMSGVVDLYSAELSDEERSLRSSGLYYYPRH